MHVSNTLPMLGSPRMGGTGRWFTRRPPTGFTATQRKQIRQGERALVNAGMLAEVADAALDALAMAEVDEQVADWARLTVLEDTFLDFTADGDEDDYDVMCEAYAHMAETEADAREERIAMLGRPQFDPSDVQWGFTVRAGVGFDHGDQSFRSSRRPGPSVEDLDGDHRYVA